MFFVPCYSRLTARDAFCYPAIEYGDDVREAAFYLFRVLHKQPVIDNVQESTAFFLLPKGIDRPGIHILPPEKKMKIISDFFLWLLPGIESLMN